MFKVIKNKYQIAHWEYKCMWTETSGRFCVSQRRDGGWGWVRLHSGRLWEKHTSSYSSNSNQFQSRGGRIFYTSGPRKKNKYTEVEREEITSLRETERGWGGGGGTSGFRLANKKAKQSIMSESPHSWLLLPGSSRMKQDKTRICKLIRSLRMAGERWWWGRER